MEYYIDLDSGGFTMDEFQEIKLMLGNTALYHIRNTGT